MSQTKHCGVKYYKIIAYKQIFFVKKKFLLSHFSSSQQPLYWNNERKIQKSYWFLRNHKIKIKKNHASMTF